LKKYFYILYAFLLILNSCDNTVSYIGEFEQQYSLNCILRSDKSTQIVTIKRSYSPNEDPNNSDIQNAIVKLTFRDSTYIFKDSLLAETHYAYPAVKYFYYLDDIVLAKNTVYKIEATLPNGIVLSSETKTPRYSKLNMVEKDDVLPKPNNAPAYYMWSLTRPEDQLLFGPAFYIRYFILGEEDRIIYKEVPGFHYQNNLLYEVSRESLDDAMQSISNGIVSAGNVNIIDAQIEIKVFDRALGIYVNSIRTFEDEFSIRVAEANVSNIEGGFGVFGSYFSEKSKIIFEEEYVSSFGYVLSDN
jgi:hypothetical protein